MKRYLLFAGDDYYPSGGWADFQGSYDTTEEAKTALLQASCGVSGLSFDWYHIVDTGTREVVEDSRGK